MVLKEQYVVLKFAIPKPLYDIYVEMAKRTNVPVSELIIRAMYLYVQYLASQSEANSRGGAP